MYAGLRRWVAVAAALFALAGCSAMSADAAGRSNEPPPWDPWIAGGQTGSLMPRCGVPGSAEWVGVPASSEGFVVYTSQCEGSYFSAQDLTLRDAQGNVIAFGVHDLGGGAVLITPESTLVPGTYWLGNSSRWYDGDDDAGTNDDDAGAAPSDPQGPFVDETLQVQPATPEPVQLGTIRRVGEQCSPTFKIALDPAVVEHVSLIALDFRIDGGEVQPFTAYGELEIGDDGGALVTLPEDVWLSLPEGLYTITWIARLAGSDMPLPPIDVELEVACDPPPPYEYPPEEIGAGDGTCSFTRAGRARAGVAEGLLIALAAVLLARRRRQRS